MHRVSLIVSLMILAGCASHGVAPAKSSKSSASARITQSFDSDWRFAKEDAAGAEKPEFSDTGWRKLDVPHDWSIEGPFAQNNPSRGAGAFLPSAAVWYRKHFTVPASESQRRFFIEFDGVMANSDVWINGVKLGHRPYGYSSFRYEMTGHLNFGNKPNVLAVRADTSQQPASRWYAGAGIYRHVRLVAADPVHIDQWATFVTTPKVSAEEATVHVKTTVMNQSDAPREVAVQVALRDDQGNEAARGITQPQSIAPGKSADFEQDITVKQPQIWDIGHPLMYSALTSVQSNGATLDDEATRFGIRQFEFKSESGFWLNGKNFKLKGVCIHGDDSALGVAVPESAWERRFAALKEIGVNAIRTAHNPPAPEFLDACDRMGMLVMDENFDCWTVGKNTYDYHLYFNEWSKIDTRDMVRRDRNHPSIVLYSTGNEIHDTPKEELAKEILAGLVPVFHENDPTRPVTQALFRPNTSHDYTNGLADLLDVIGTNYRDTELQAAWKAKSGRKIIGTEQGHTRDTWLNLRDNEAEAGQFLWSGIDYLGESLSWPTVSAGSGLLDRTGMIKPMALERQAWWAEKPVVNIVRRVVATGGGRGRGRGAGARGAATNPAGAVAGGGAATNPTGARAGGTGDPGADPGFAPLIANQVQFPDWSPANAAAHNETVEVYSNCNEVELTLNGKSLGSKKINADDAPRIWQVAYEPGTLKAIGKNKGEVVASNELRTAGKPAKIMLTPERTKLPNDWEDVCYVRATVTDENGLTIPVAHDSISFTISGPGAIIAVDSADPTSHESFQATQRLAFQGRCFAIVRSSAAAGKITISASAEGLQSGQATLDAAPPVR